MTSEPVRSACEALDAEDPLAGLRRAFDLPDGLVYLAGNSLGPPLRGMAGRLTDRAVSPWASELVESWRSRDWIGWPERLGDRLASLLGASEGEVVVTDSTSINLYKAIRAALQSRKRGGVVLQAEEEFPTNLYMAKAAAEDEGASVVLQPAAELARSLRSTVDVVTFGHVDFRTGRRLPVSELVAAAREVGARTVLDCSHSVGAIPVRLNAWGVDFAVGCTYKYLNGGPGAPAFIFVAKRWLDEATSPLPGWLGHQAPFEMQAEYRPGPGISRFRCGTPPIVSLGALDVALDFWDTVDREALERKRCRLGDLFVELVDELGRDDLDVVSPREAEARAGQISVRHESAYPVVRALADRGVIGDFREPDLMRFGLAPAYLRYVDVADAVAKLGRILSGRTWDTAAYHQRAVVT